MNLHHLKVFLAVAEAGSISAGAERLHISQPAVTREIRDLEASLDLRLFDRLPRGVQLTEGGLRLLDYAQRLLARDALLPVVAPHHPLAASQTLAAEKLQDYPLYMREPGSGARVSVEQAYRAHGLEPRAGMAIGSTEALKRLLADGQGIAWLSQRVVERELANGELRHLPVQDLQIERELHVLWRLGASLSPAPAAFLALTQTSE